MSQQEMIEMVKTLAACLGAIMVACFLLMLVLVRFAPDFPNDDGERL